MVLGPGRQALPASISDSILLSYASLLAEGFSVDRRGQEGRRELYDLRSRGPSIGGRRITIVQADSLVNEWNRSGRESHSAGSSPQAPAFDVHRATESLRAFLEGEQRRLDELRRSMRGANLLSKSDFRLLASESDYLWWGFPDQDRSREMPQDFLNRLVPQVEAWAYRIGALVESLG